MSTELSEDRFSVPAESTLSSTSSDPGAVESVAGRRKDRSNHQEIELNGVRNDTVPTFMYAHNFVSVPEDDEVIKVKKGGCCGGCVIS